jgi:predicted glycosyl hydrolase (DUF1957 family)
MDKTEAKKELIKKLDDHITFLQSVADDLEAGKFAEAASWLDDVRNTVQDLADQCAELAGGWDNCP